ncbi:maleylpyruvate isomerase N-terminal domain-containing protein [Phytomonospora sp. NPDC050363]|uniref:maleylpyruvate isomerase N-terminal domain-containing protein n=1 Tax=Phytomonospora sp. NPDC050363 TaxID=3155642 RepID=UPI0033C1EF37
MTTTSNATRDAYLTAADSAAALLADPAVAVAWDKPSALAEFGVGGLAGHLAYQVLSVASTLGNPLDDGELVPLLGHYARGAWLDADIDDDVMVGIRNSGYRIAAEGPQALARTVADEVAALREVFGDVAPDRVVALGRVPWSLTFDDFLMTRTMELAVHSDDLAVSVGLDTPALPPEVTGPVLDLLAALAVKRHGPVALMRAYSRAERAPKTIAAF